MSAGAGDMAPRLPGGPVLGVLIDYGGTLVDHRRPGAALERAYAAIAARLATELQVEVPAPRTLLARVHDRVEDEIAATAGSGTLREADAEALQARAYASLGLRPPRTLLDELMRIEQEAWWTSVSVREGVVEALGALRRAGLRLGLASNAAYRPGSMREQVAFVGLLPLFDSTTFSGEVGWRKPSPRFYERALSDLGAAAEVTVMVGDDLANDVRGARASGLRAVWVRPGGAQAGARGDGLGDAVITAIGELPALLGVEPARPETHV